MRAEARAALLAAAFLAAPARASDVAAPSGGAAAAALASRDVATVGTREVLLGEQAAAARAGARWRLRALYRLTVTAHDLPPVTRARALAAGARAVGRDLDEARILVAEREHARADRLALEASALAAPTPGAAPALAPPVAGAVRARFGAAPGRVVGLVVSRAGVRLAAREGEGVRAPGAGVVARVAAEAAGLTVVLDLGAGWTAIVSGLGEVTVEPGASVAAGQRVGVAGPAGEIGFEVWRGRRPVDPLLLARGGRSASAPAALAPPDPGLAAAPTLP